MHRLFIGASISAYSSRRIVKGILLAVMLTVLGISCRDRTDAQVAGSVRETSRQAVVAGRFYPGAAAELSEMVAGFLAQAAAADIPGEVRALIVPHAGYIYSGQVAGSGYRTLSEDYKRVFILASNHSARAPAFRFSVPEFADYQTPLGKVRVSPIAGDLLKNDLFSFVPEAHNTHIVEVQLPFLQKVLGEFEIIPIITGRVGAEDIERAARIISPHLDRQTLIVVSSDLSHYHPYDYAKKLDKSCVQSLADLDYDKAAHCEACGLDASLILLQIARRKAWAGKLLEYKNSGDTAGPKDKVVGYSSIAFYGGEQRSSKDEITEQDRRSLLRLSRSVLSSAVKKNRRPNLQLESLAQELREKRACFVTLEKNHSLRGCIGHLLPRLPLYQCVIENTINAASKDGRFKPVAPEELSEIDIEVSVPTLPEQLERNSPQQLLDSLVPGKHGVILKSGSRRATFLPQVWEDLPDKRQFLSRLCRKGGASRSCWKDPSTRILTYQVRAFKESQLK